MRNWILAFSLFSACLPAGARPHLKDRSGSVQLTISSQNAANTADPNNQLYEYAVQVKNVGQSSLDISNNEFYVTDSAGANHYVERTRRAELATVQPGQSFNFERIFISIPRNLKPVEMHLARIGSCPIR
ncbi:hypothetical protein JST97_21305 [bacterium]|nr:hypothetical protein [bacterium]